MSSSSQWSPLLAPRRICGRYRHLGVSRNNIVVGVSFTLSDNSVETDAIVAITGVDSGDKWLGLTLSGKVLLSTSFRFLENESIVVGNNGHVKVEADIGSSIEVTHENDGQILAIDEKHHLWRICIDSVKDIGCINSSTIPSALLMIRESPYFGWTNGHVENAQQGIIHKTCGSVVELISYKGELWSISSEGYLTTNTNSSRLGVKGKITGAVVAMENHILAVTSPGSLIAFELGSPHLVARIVPLYMPVKCLRVCGERVFVTFINDSWTVLAYKSCPSKEIGGLLDKLENLQTMKDVDDHQTLQYLHMRRMRLATAIDIKMNRISVDLVVAKRGWPFSLSILTSENFARLCVVFRQGNKIETQSIEMVGLKNIDITPKFICDSSTFCQDLQALVTIVSCHVDFGFRRTISRVLVQKEFDAVETGALEARAYRLGKSLRESKVVPIINFPRSNLPECHINCTARELLLLILPSLGLDFAENTTFLAWAVIGFVKLQCEIDGAFIVIKLITSDVASACAVRLAVLLRLSKIIGNQLCVPHATLEGKRAVARLQNAVVFNAKDMKGCSTSTLTAIQGVLDAWDTLKGNSA